jgi:hypothetical protein
MEDDGVAATAALYDALSLQNMTAEQHTALLYWKKEALLLLQDLGLNQTAAEDTCHLLLTDSVSRVTNRNELIEQVGEVLRANIELVVASR